MTNVLALDIKKVLLLCIMLLTLSLFSHCYAITEDKAESISALNLHPCKDNQQFLCGNISAPLDYKNPHLGKVELPISIHRATQKSRGYLILNFGGPWADNVKVLPSITSNRLTATMIKYFDLLVINPRGANPNTIQCDTKDNAKLNKINEAMGKIFSQGNESDIDALYELAKKNRAYVNTINCINTLAQIIMFKILKHFERL